MSSTTARPLRLLATFAFAIALLFLTVPARAQNAAAESLFQTGKQQLGAGNYADACKSFAESQRLEPRVGTLLNLALCNEKQGKIASAWATYKEASALARRTNDPERASAADGFAVGLEPRLSKLTIVAKTPPAGMIVKRDGVEVSSLGVAVAVDPGRYTVTAEAPGHAQFSAEVTVSGEGDNETLEIPPLPTGSGTVSGGSSGGGISGLAIGGFIAGGVGLIGIGVGTAFGVVAMGTASDAEEDPNLCPNRACTPAGREEIDAAETQATISTVGFAIGGVALAGGVALIVAGFVMGDEPAETTASIVPWVYPIEGGSVAGLAGRF